MHVGASGQQQSAPSYTYTHTYTHMHTQTHKHTYTHPSSVKTDTMRKEFLLGEAGRTLETWGPFCFLYCENEVKSCALTA